MSGRQERTNELRGLLIDVRADIKALNRLYDAMGSRKVTSFLDASDEVLILGLAAWLHHVYTGVESLFVRVAQVLDGYSSRAEDWHRRLLVSMGQPLDDVRPAILSAPTFAWLDDLRRFRHLFRHAYGAELDQKRIKDLVLVARDMKPALDQDLHRLEGFIVALVECHEEPGM
jgi:hypothetical protein